MAKPAMIGETAGKRFARELSALLRDVQARGVEERALLECMLGYAAGRLIGTGATKTEVRALLESLLEHMPEVTFPSSGGKG